VDDPPAKRLLWMAVDQALSAKGSVGTVITAVVTVTGYLAGLDLPHSHLPRHTCCAHACRMMLGRPQRNARPPEQLITWT
jgi:hypothetical protein